MAYRIVYQWDKEKTFLKKPWKPRWVAAGVTALLAAVAIRWLLPDVEILELLFSPFMDESVMDAFQSMITQLEQGESFTDAAAVFCVEILSNGG